MLLPGGLTPFEKIVPPELFYFCLQESLRKYKTYLYWSFEENRLLKKLLVSKDRIHYKRIENTSTQGV